MSNKSRTSDTDFPGQHEGEVVEFIFRQHPLVMRKTLIIGLLVIMIPVIPLAIQAVWNMPELVDWLIRIAFATPIVVFLAWIHRWVGWYYSVNIVTNERLIIIRQKGLFDRNVEEWQLKDVTNLNYHINGFQAVIFSFGNIEAKTYVGEFELKYIHKPAEIHSQLLEAVRNAGGGGSTRQPNLR